MFYNCSQLKSIDVSNFKTDSLSYVGYMFAGCSSLTSIDLSTFTINIKSDLDYLHMVYIEYLFSNCSKLSYIDISKFSESLNYTISFDNISNSGTIKVNKNSSKKVKDVFNYLKLNWTFIEN